MCDRGMLVSSPSVACRVQRSTWVAAGWHRRGLSGHMRIVTKTSWISTRWLKDQSTHQPSATVDSLDGDHRARREHAGQERGGVEADDVGGVKGVQAEACACTDRVDNVCSSCHSMTAGIHFVFVCASPAKTTLHNCRTSCTSRLAQAHKRA